MPACCLLVFGKAHLLPYEKSNYQANVPLELVYSDDFGRIKQFSTNGMKYMIMSIDDFFRFVWVYFMNEKFEAFDKLKEFKVEVERETKHST